MREIVRERERAKERERERERKKTDNTEWGSGEKLWVIRFVCGRL